jgi:ubiquinone/menaquinone biosynthesis C-methylase UbiE
MSLKKPGDFNPSDLRNYYEEQGRAISSNNGAISCSEKATVAAVIRMITEYSADFQTVADVGCGANLIYDEALIELGKHVVGVDFTFSFLKLAPANTSVSLIQGDATALPFPAEAFDAVICSETVEHIPNDLMVVNELARVLRKRGLLFFTVPNLWNAARIIQMVKKLDPKVRLMTGHLREYSLEKVIRLLEGQFEILKAYTVGFGWSGKFGGRIERLIELGYLSRFGSSVAVAARKL